MEPNQLFDLGEKVAIVTGGAGGIGVVYAEALCIAGASVVVADVNIEAAQALAESLGKEGHSAIGVYVDVSSAESARAMATASTDTFGGVDILVNNAAMMTNLPRHPLSTMPVEDWDRVFNVNLRGALLCAQAVVDTMTERGGGRIVNGLSAAAFMAGNIYGLTKYALHGLTVSLAAELGPKGINVNGIAPGLVDNESGYASLPKDSPTREALARRIPGKTSGPPEDLIGTLLLLCSKAGDWINGQTISVDGGWVMRL
jgi:NAD(P)-dependent dehydrogenase (short-subunit alcohol dehydrogenase family)